MGRGKGSWPRSYYFEHRGSFAEKKTERKGTTTEGKKRSYGAETTHADSFRIGGLSEKVSARLPISPRDLRCRRGRRRRRTGRR